MSKQTPLVIWGAGGHAMVVADIVRLQESYRIIGFLDNVNLQRHGTEFCGASILGGDEQLDRLLDEGIDHILLGFGDCKVRLELTSFLETKGFRLPTVIHPRAVVAQDVILGPGTVVAAGAVINPGTWVGKSVIINTAASVDHECMIADAAHICPGARLAGHIRVGRATQVGVGAIVIERINVGNESVIGAGTIIVKDVPDHVVVYGNPPGTAVKQI
ncbi:MAG: acetyltransferase [Caldisericales bacterium]|nr:acetyltransferase [Caldisericales bacterium]